MRFIQSFCVRYINQLISKKSNYKTRRLQALQKPEASRFIIIGGCASLTTLQVLSDYVARHLASNPTYGWHVAKYLVPTLPRGNAYKVNSCAKAVKIIEF